MIMAMLILSCSEDEPVTEAPPLLIEAEVVTAGSDCEAGGQKLSIGTDTNGDGQLSADEV